MQHTILFTGFPGFIGARLVRRLRRRPEGAHVVAVVVPPMRGAAEALAARIAAEDGGPPLELVEGDIARPGLGLSDEVLAGLRGRVTQVFHLAAIYDLATPQAVAETVNVKGTEHVLDVCEQLSRLERLVYFSTCYVAGTRSGAIAEADLAADQRFRNHYESTKYAAELAVRARMDRIPTTIVRPSVVVGDSSTGETAKYDGPYFLLALFARLEARGLGLLPRAFPVFGHGRARFNVVPVDYIVEGAARLSEADAAIGRTAQLSDPDPLTFAEFAELAHTTFGSGGPYLKLPVWLGRTVIRLPGARWTLGLPAEIFDYYNTDQEFETATAAELLAPGGLSCPSPREYLPVLVDYLRRHPFAPGPPIAAAQPVVASAG